MSASRIAGFDPVRAGDAASASAYAKVYEGLLQFDPQARPYRVTPALAQTMPEISPDGLVVRFRIRSGIFFSDDPCFEAAGGRGRELVAEDFVYSIRRVADPRNASSGFWAFRDRIAGLDAFRARALETGAADYDAPIEGLRATGRYELEIRLLRPYPQLLWVLAMHYAYAVPHEAVERYGDGFVNHPVGTGPFLLESWRRNYRMVFARNPKWRETGRREPMPGVAGEKRDGRTTPGLDRLVQVVVADPSTQWQLFLRGDLAFSAISRENWDLVAGPDGTLRDEWMRRGIRWASTEALEVHYIGFNMDDPVVGKNKALRQAMALAFDGAEWIAFYKGRAERPTSPVPPGVAGYAPAENPYPFSPELARQRLAEAGYPGGIDPATGRRLQVTLEIGDSDNTDTRQSIDLFVQFMDRIGVVVRPSYNNRPAFFEKLSRRQAQMFRLNWVADYPDAQNFLQLFVSENASPGPNRTNYSNSDADRLYRKLILMNDSPERTELCREMTDIVMKDCPWILTHIPKTHILYHDWVEGFYLGPFLYGSEKYLSVQGSSHR